MLDSFPLPCRVRHTRRRGSIAIKVGREAVTILAPRGTSASAIQALLAQRHDWIEEAIVAQAAQPQRQFTDGERLWFDGEQYPLAVAQAPTTELVIEPDRLLLYLPAGSNRQQRLQALLDGYQQRAERRWPDQVARWAARMGVEVQNLKIRPYKSRWGACTATGKISLNTLLMMAPPAVQHYVIVHELCHRVHLNHSPAFWALVEHWCPDHRTLRRWLKTRGSELRLD